MKPTMALKPLVFALAAVMAMAAQANDNDHGHGHHHHGPKGPTWEQQLSIDSAASAYVGDTQDSSGNSVLNQGTNNTAGADNSLNGSNGNMGANVAGAMATNKTTPPRWLPLMKASSSVLPRQPPPRINTTPITTSKTSLLKITPRSTMRATTAPATLAST